MNTSIFQDLFSYKIVRYGIVGGISTLIHFSVTFLYIYYIENSVYQANILGFLIAYIFSYLMQSKFVFKNNSSIKKAIKYFIVQFSALLVSLTISNVIEYNSYLKTVFVVILLPIITFFAHKTWTFKSKEL